LIAAIKEKREGVDKEIKLWAENIEMLHSKYRNLTLETDASETERLITIVQVASDDLKKGNGSYSSTLHTLETTNELIKTNLAETDEKLRQIDLDFERAIEKLI